MAREGVYSRWMVGGMTMFMDLYNTLSQSIEPFRPAGPAVTIYVCGITPYDTTHLGHAFTYTAADILIRHLESQGRRVIYAQNVTDVDDDILRKAREVGEDWRAVGNQWTAHFIEDMRALNVRPPDYFPRASDAIDGIVAMAEALLKLGLAYRVGGSVYYQVANWPEFGRLSHIPRVDMLAIANERGNRPDDPNKRDPLDFVLWQAQAPGEPAWDSPWGPGRPGWHIECSTLSTSLLGDSIDLHGGGSDLIFPHHECEIAQSEPATGSRPFVRCWIHTAMVEHEGAKMSKSLGNLIMVSDLLQHWSADALRLYLGRHHYRHAWAHDASELERAGHLAEKSRAAVATVGGGAKIDAAGFEKRFAAALDDDLNTPAALEVLEQLADAILAGGADTGAADGGADSGPEILRRMGEVFGLRLGAAGIETRVSQGWATHLAQFS
jgi:L-cysteine:1D-myo-inositol 2-amino-2-deoxy-alpha-D-glucopyranoside ligase